MSQNQRELRLDDVAEWERERRRELRNRLIRWGIGIPLILFSYPWLGIFFGPLVGWLGPFLVVLGSILIALDIAGFFSQFVGRLLWPKSKFEPRPLYSIAEALAAKGKYAEAEKEYEKIIQEFPNEVKPHLDLISIAVMRLNNAELAEQLYQRGMNLLQNPGARETLTKMYAAIRSRPKSRDKEDKKVVLREKIEELDEREKRGQDERINN